MIEVERRRQLVIQRVAGFRVHHRRIRFDAELTEQRRKKKRFVFAVAPALIENLGRLMRLVRVASHLDAEVTDVVLDETDGGDDLLVARLVLAANSFGEIANVVARFVVELKERVGPLRHVAP